jgi:tRNA (guanine-N7-)-methyltransferase
LSKRIKIRQHVNPLGIRYQQPIDWPDWSQIYADPNLPLHIDIGCAWGKFVRDMATAQPTWNFLGIEIRQPIIAEANRLRDEQGLHNLHYAFANINVSLASLLNSLPTGACQRISIQYPDPCFKVRHAKRRVVQPALVNTLAQHLPPQAKIFLQSDLEWVAQEMADRFDYHPNFQKQSPDWLPENPLGIPTERETYTLNKGLPVFRQIFEKVDTKGL